MKQVLILIGHLGQDPEARTTQNGTNVANFTMACKSGWGERERTTWFRCTAFNKRAEALINYATKGDLIMVRGTLELEKVKEEHGKGFWVNTIVDEWTFLNAKGKKDKSPSQTPPMAKDQDFDAGEEDSDLPF